MKNQSSFKMLNFNVFSSRVCVEKHVSLSKKVRKSSRKVKITFEIWLHWYPEGATCPHLYPYAPIFRKNPWNTMWFEYFWSDFLGGDIPFLFSKSVIFGHLCQKVLESAKTHWYRASAARNTAFWAAVETPYISHVEHAIFHIVFRDTVISWCHIIVLSNN